MLLRRHVDESARLLASGHVDGLIQLWNIDNLTTSGNQAASNRRLERTILALTNCVTALEWLGPTMLASAGNGEPSVHIWDAESGHLIEQLTGVGGHSSGSTVHALRLLDSVSGMLASGGDDKFVLVWSVISSQCVHRLVGHTARVSALERIASDRLASGSWDMTVRIWRVELHIISCLHPLHGHTAEVTCLTMLGDHGWLASGAKNSVVILWDPLNGVLMQTFFSPRVNKPITALVAVVRDHGQMASNSPSTRASMWTASGVSNSASDCAIRVGPS